jgi:hypothetical protein
MYLTIVSLHCDNNEKRNIRFVQPVTSYDQDGTPNDSAILDAAEAIAHAAPADAFDAFGQKARNWLTSADYDKHDTLNEALATSGGKRNRAESFETRMVGS